MAVQGGPAGTTFREVAQQVYADVVVSAAVLKAILDPTRPPFPGAVLRLDGNCNARVAGPVRWRALCVRGRVCWRGRGCRRVRWVPACSRSRWRVRGGAWCCMGQGACGSLAEREAGLPLATAHVPRAHGTHAHGTHAHGTHARTRARGNGCARTRRTVLPVLVTRRALRSHCAPLRACALALALAHRGGGRTRARRMATATAPPCRMRTPPRCSSTFRAPSS